jgi:hypothetical protein
LRLNRPGDWAIPTIARVPGAIGIQLPGIQLPGQRKTDAIDPKRAAITKVTVALIANSQP